jgi:hypothetical protein
MNARISTRHVLNELYEQREEQQTHLGVSIMTGVGAAMILAGITAMMEVLLTNFNAPLEMRIGTYLTMTIFGSIITAYGIMPLIKGKV